MGYQVLARKWRPAKFAELVGQEHVVAAISNALDNDRLHHAYLFTGTRGVGKTTIARIFAKSLNCETGVSADPCGVCATCREIAAGNFVDLLEIDAASRTKVEDTRELLDNVQYRPTRGKYKVYLIDEVHMLSKHSFNALLKTLEEPPPHVKFLLATTDPQKLPVTILSRCLQLNLKALTQAQIQAQLSHILERENIAYESPALQELSRAAQGSMRDSLSLTDQAIAQGNGEITARVVTDMLGLLDKASVLKLLNAVLTKDKYGVLQQVEQMSVQAPDYAQVLAEFMSYLHQVALTQFVPDICKLDGYSAKGVYVLAKQVAPEQIQLLYQIALEGRKDLPHAIDPRVGLEMTLLRMLAFAPSKIQLDDDLLSAQEAAMMDLAVNRRELTQAVPSRPEPAQPLPNPSTASTDDIQGEPASEESVTAAQQVAKAAIASPAKGATATELDTSPSSASAGTSDATESTSNQSFGATAVQPPSTAQPAATAALADITVADSSEQQLSAAHPLDDLAPDSCAESEQQTELDDFAEFSAMAENLTAEHSSLMAESDVMREREMTPSQGSGASTAADVNQLHPQGDNRQQPDDTVPEASGESGLAVTEQLLALHSSIATSQQSVAQQSVPQQSVSAAESPELNDGGLAQKFATSALSANPLSASPLAPSQSSDEVATAAEVPRVEQSSESELQLGVDRDSPTAPASVVATAANNASVLDNSTPVSADYTTEVLSPTDPQQLAVKTSAATAAESMPDCDAAVAGIAAEQIDFEVPYQLADGSRVTLSRQLDTWAQLIDEMQLVGLSKQVAAHSMYHKQGEHITLTLADNQAHLLSPVIETRLREAFRQFLQQDIQLTITPGKVTDTPHAVQRAIDAMRLAHARDIINEDRCVALLCAEFEASVVADSIKPR